MKLSELSPGKGARKRRKIVGRGPSSGHGKTSCRGHKGYKARTGSSIKMGFEGGQMPLYKRLPKRGFKSMFKLSYHVVNIEDLEARFESGEITPQLIREKGLVRSSTGPIKILGKGELKKAFIVSSQAFSVTAAEKIKLAGGAVKVIS